MLQSMGSQRAGHDPATEQQQLPLTEKFHEDQMISSHRGTFTADGSG